MLSRHNGSRHTKAQVQKKHLEQQYIKTGTVEGPSSSNAVPPTPSAKVEQCRHLVAGSRICSGHRGNRRHASFCLSRMNSGTHTCLNPGAIYASTIYLELEPVEKRSFTPIKPQKGEICPVQFKKDHTSVLCCSSSGQLGARQVPVGAFHGFSFFFLFFFRQFLYNSSTTLE